ncbi:MAG: assimilatory sulfite reductase (NADPH) flavoprotein subunit [Pseudomonadota bacterium]
MFLKQIPQDLAPLTADQMATMEALMGQLTPLQQAWVSGYFAASANGAGTLAAPVEAAPATLTVLYGSQTGNAKHVAADLAEQAKARGMNAKLLDMADYKPAKLKDETHLAIVVSTYGEGEPPEPAQKLYDFVGSKKAPKLEGLNIAVLGLGDTSYEFFNQTAKDFEERLVALGATVVVEKALLDVDYDDYAEDWIKGALDIIEPDLKTAAPANNVVQLAPSAPLYSKKNPYQAEITTVQKITGRDSTKDVRHIEISLDGSGLTYQPGDALGVYFLNDPTEVDEVLKALKLNDETLRRELIEDYELTQSYPGFVTAYAEATSNAALAKIAEDKAALRAYIEDRQIFDILREHPAEISADALKSCLRKIQPRLYSIASSQAEMDDEVHLTLGVVEYDAHGRPHLGGASGYLAHRAEEGSEIKVFVEENTNFRLPADPSTPTVMIGPGTGIAPFRAFLQERDAQGAEGANWLFFGNPHFTQDFLYQVELQSYLKSGLLSKLSVAFSRDQKDKIYVQDRLRENGADLFEWLEKGAHLYVCGDATRMAKDVHQALLDVIAEHGGKSAEEAEGYLADLRDAKRYQRDIY